MSKFSGYSGKSLAEKLGISKELTALIFDPPQNYKDLIGEQYSLLNITSKKKSKVDFVHAFFTGQKDLEQQFPHFVKSLNEKGMIWISWPKKTAKVESDLNENIVREIGLQLGVVDVKVCAVDEIWSGLKFLRRKLT